MDFRFCYLPLITVLCCGSFAAGQNNYRLSGPDQDKLVLPFEFSQNLIIIPCRVNQSGSLKLVLDSGISNTIITGLSQEDTVTMKEARKITVGGLGDGLSIDAYYSRGNRIDIQHPEDSLMRITGQGMDVYVLASDQFELSRQLGIKVNGLIGSDLFMNFVISIDPINKEITFSNREHFNIKRKTRSYTAVPVRMMNGKAYIDIDIVQDNDKPLTVRLLIDTGASLSFWIAPISDSSIVIPQKTVKALLGQGLNGSITGVNGRIKKAQIGPFVFRKPLVSFPDSASVAGLTLNTGRHGSLGNDILRRFNVIFDYQGSVIYLKPNKWFKAPFTYNRSGMDVEKPDPQIPVYSIFNIIPGSPADKAGLKPGDIIEYINYQPAFTLNLDDINNILYGESGRLVLIKVIRNEEKLKFQFHLEGKI